ncbi:MAG: VanZ family protein [Clostridia bacterium]|nr:VanZ family protein [Clostridia bacterium]
MTKEESGMEKKKKANGWLLVVIGVTTLLIWGQSLLPATSSPVQSDTVRGWLSGLLGQGPVALFLLTHTRKVAHFTEFAVLGCEWSLYRHRLCEKRGCWMWLSGLPVALADECLQFASPGRAPQIRDVGLDYAGYLCGFLVVWAVVRIVAEKRKNKT